MCVRACVRASVPDCILFSMHVFSYVLNKTRRGLLEANKLVEEATPARRKYRTTPARRKHRTTPAQRNHRAIPARRKHRTTPARRRHRTTPAQRKHGVVQLYCASGGRVMVRVAVLGGGIIGVGTAVFALKHIPGLDVTIISDEFTPNTTSDGVAGLWSPFLTHQTPPDKIHLWSKKTHDLFRYLWQTSNADEAGITLIPVCWYHQNDEKIPYWADIPMGFRELTKKEVKEVDDRMKCGFHYVTFTCEPIMMLPFFMRQFKEMGGKIQRRRVDSLMKLVGHYDIIIHCTGVQAHHVVGDKSVHPQRGQAMRVKAPWLFQVTLCDYNDDTCIYQIPNRHSVLLGGTHQEGDWNTNTYPKDTKHILDGGCKVTPGLKNAEVLKEWVGLRPGRWQVRLERETIHHNGKKLEVIHNYGHGGAGITLFWGCAEEATNLLKDCLREMKGEALQSKL